METRNYPPTFRLYGMKCKNLIFQWFTVLSDSFQTRRVITSNQKSLRLRLSKHAGENSGWAQKRGNISPGPQKRNIPPILVKTQKVETTFVYVASSLVTFEYTTSDLNVRCAFKLDHSNIIWLLKDSGVKYYTFNPNPGQQIRYVLKGLPPSQSVQRSREKDV